MNPAKEGWQIVNRKVTGSSKMANGSSYIDVTLVTERTSGKINSWRLIRDLMTTSHALLETLV